MATGGAEMSKANIITQKQQNQQQQSKKPRYIAPILQKSTISSLPVGVQLSSFSAVMSATGITIHDNSQAELGKTD